MKTTAVSGAWVMGLLLAGCAAPASEPAPPEVYGVAHPAGAPAAKQPTRFPSLAVSGRHLAALPRGSFLRVSSFPSAPSAGSISWGATHGGSGDDVAFAVTADAANDIYVAGAVDANGDVGCGVHAGSVRSAFVAQYTSEGVCTWATYFDGDDDIAASAVAYDTMSGNVYVTGLFSGTANIAGDVKESAGGYDGFVAKISSGAITWAQTFGGASDDYPFAIAAGGNRVAVGGAFYDTTTFGGSSAATSQGDADAFVSTYVDATGAFDASWTAGGSSWDAVNGLTYAASTGFVAAGTYAGSVDFGVGSSTSAGGQDGFVTTFDGALHTAALRSVGGSGDDALQGVAVMGNGNVATSGYFQASADAGGGSISGTGAYAGLVATYSSSLDYVGATSLQASDAMIPESLTLDPATGGILVAGFFRGSATLGASEYSASVEDAFVAAYGSDGSLTWSGTAGGDGTTEGLGIAVSSAGKIVLVGDFTASADFGSGPVASAGGYDLFFLALDD